MSQTWTNMVLSSVQWACAFMSADGLLLWGRSYMRECVRLWGWARGLINDWRISPAPSFPVGWLSVCGRILDRRPVLIMVWGSVFLGAHMWSVCITVQVFFFPLVCSLCVPSGWVSSVALAAPCSKRIREVALLKWSWSVCACLRYTLLVSAVNRAESCECERELDQITENLGTRLTSIPTREGKEWKRRKQCGEREEQ